MSEAAGEGSEAAEARPGPAKRRWEGPIEIGEAVLLAIIAISTAWSGYQAAKWGGNQALLYGEASRSRFEADAAATLGEQHLSADASMLNGWLQAHAAGERDLEAVFVRRFSPGYRVAFEAWLKTDPLHDPGAPPGPAAMPQYRNPWLDQAATLNDEASTSFEQGTEARRHGDDFVRTTVLFASILMLVTLASRFRIRRVRLALLGVAGALLVVALVTMIALPRA